MLDELPYGNFIEIEGETEEIVHALSERLELNWEASIARGYSVLFEQVRKNMNLSFRDLSFANFEGIRISTEHLEVQPADAPHGEKHD